VTDFPAWLPENVSRETINKLTEYSALAEKWSKKINIVSKNDLSRIWERHICDSLQIWQPEIIPRNARWLDVGSGGGFPIVVIAILASQQDANLTLSCVESDKRKCAFLRHVVQTLNLRLNVMSERVEHLTPQKADVLSARAFSALPDLFRLTERHFTTDTVFLLQKGETWQEEIEIALKAWQFTYDSRRSKTNAKAALLEIRNVQRI